MAVSMLIPRDDNGASYPAVRPHPIADQAVTGSVASTAALDAAVLRLKPTTGIRYVQYHPDAAQPDPGAAGAGAELDAGQIEYVAHKPGWKIAVVKQTGEADGSLNICYGR